MSEANILNPAVTSLFNPEYGYREALPPMLAGFQARGGRRYTRRVLIAGRVMEISWANALLATKHSLQQWADQYEQDFFTLADWERSRYFSGCFDGPLTFSPAANDRWNISARFIEIPGLAMYAYPTNWARDAIMLAARDGFAADLVKVTGTWTYAANANAFAASDYTSTTNNDTAEWLYYGYGFKVWSRTGPDLGIVEVSCTDNAGTVETAATNVDLYTAGAVASAAVHTSANLKLGEHRVKLRVTNTKNGSSSSVKCVADAIQVMR